MWCLLSTRIDIQHITPRRQRGSDDERGPYIEGKARDLSAILRDPPAVSAAARETEPKTLKPRAKPGRKTARP